MADDVTLNSMSGGPVVATDDSGTGHVQIVKLAYSADGSRTHVDADTDGLKVKVSNATVTVALGSALPAGSNVIGGVTQSGTWNVGITGTPTVTVGNASIPVTDNGGSLTVDGTVAATQLGSWSLSSINDSVSPGTSPLALGKAEDAPFSSGDVGVMALAVRNDDAATTLSGSNSDYTPIAVDSRGRTLVIERGATIASTSASVTTTSGQIVASSATRRTIVLTNLGTDYVWIGASGVTDNQGIRLAPGQALTIDRSPTAAVHAKAASGTQTVAIFTESD